MKLGTRLLLPLLPTAALIMLAYAGWALAEREDTLAPSDRQETQAYATALGLAFDYALRDVRRENVQAIIDEVSQSPTVYGIVLYDSLGTRTLVTRALERAPAAPPEALRGVLRSGRTAAFERTVDDQRVYSVLRALRGPRGRVTGALEVAQPMDYIAQEKARVRRRFILNTLSLLVAITLVTLWLVRRVVGRPMKDLVTGARALGRGELGYRIPEDPGTGELAELARELNGMAASLEGARAAVVREAEERVTLERRLRESEKMAAVGNLAAGLAHEIAAPLNVISGRAEMMLKRVPEPEVRERNLQIIIQQISRITTIVRNLLDFAKRREPRLVRLRADELMEGVLEFLDGELARARVALATEAAGALWLRGDPDQLHQVLVNLVLNAVQAMEAAEGRRALTIRLAGPPAGTAADATAGGTVTIEIQDSGPGIPADALARVFDPFFTTKSRGTGLGLVVARSIVQEHAGTLEARDAVPEPGAVFRITLPAAAPETGDHD